MCSTYAVTLPWPSRALHPNAREHHMALHKARRVARRDACTLCLAAGIRTIHAERLAVTLTFSPPDRRRRDTDGMIAASKALIDGIADATGVDDSRWDMIFRRADPVSGGAVIVEIEVAA